MVRIEPIAPGIFKALEILLPDPDIADRWLSTPNDNSFFNGGTIIKFEDESPWPHFESLYRWNYTEDKNVYIVEEEHIAEATFRDDGCWDIQYSIFNGVACECSYDTQAVAKFED